MAFRLTLVNVREVREALRRFLDEIADLQPLWDTYGRIMAAFEQEWFDTAGRGLWPPLAESTLRWKEARGYPPDPLIRTGALEESLTDPLQAARVDQGRSTLGTFTAAGFSWGTDVTDRRGKEYAHYHQDGEGSNPLRQVIPWPLPADVFAEFDEANREFAERVIRESGL